MPKSVRVALTLALIPLGVLALTFLPAFAEEPVAPDQQKKQEAQGTDVPELKKPAKPPLEVTPSGDVKPTGPVARVLLRAPTLFRRRR